jgi:hypothetical protein
MNHRIKELATAAFDSHILHPYYASQEEAIEKFAELIVKECMEVIDKQHHHSTDEWDRGLRSAMDGIKEHFRIKS